jgi:hypothetical protein
MSFNHLMYDKCQTHREQDENVSMLGYIMSLYKHENENKCRHELGLVGGSAVSHVKGNMVDLESELRGQTRLATMCVDRQYRPTESDWIRNDKTEPIQTTLQHLPSCQMISYRSVPLPPPMELNQCRRR